MSFDDESFDDSSNGGFSYFGGGPTYRGRLSLSTRLGKNYGAPSIDGYVMDMDRREGERDQIRGLLQGMSSQDFLNRLPMRFKKFVPVEGCDLEAICRAAGFDSCAIAAVTARLRRLSRRAHIAEQKDDSSRRKLAAAYERVRVSGARKIAKVLEPHLGIILAPRTAGELCQRRGRRETPREKARWVLGCETPSTLVEPPAVAPTGVPLYRGSGVGACWTGTSHVEYSRLSPAPDTAAKDLKGSIEEDGKITPFIGSLRR